MFTSLAEFLDHKLHQRAEKNPRYSLRAFARDLEISAPSLSLVLKGRQGFSDARAVEIAGHLDLNRTEKKLLSILTSKFGEKNPNKLQILERELEKIEDELTLQHKNPVDLLPIFQWQYIATLALTDFDDFSDTPEWVASKIEVSVAEAEQILKDLKARNLLVKNAQGIWQREAPAQIFRSEKASETYQAHYLQMIERAKLALHEVPSTMRDFSQLTVSLAPTDYEFVMQRLMNFRAELLQDLIKRGGQVESIYTLNFQLFPLTRLPETEQ